MFISCSYGVHIVYILSDYTDDCFWSEKNGRAKIVSSILNHLSINYCNTHSVIQL